MDLQKAFDYLKNVGHRLPEDEVVFIRQHREEAIPVLLQQIIAALEQGRNLPEDDDAHSMAMYLLAEFRVHEAFPHLLQYLYLDYETADFLLSDILSMNFGAILASTALDEDIPPLQKVIENTEINCYQRLAALDALITLYAEGMYGRRELSEVIGSLLLHTEDDMTFLSLVCLDCLEVFLPEHQDRIRASYKKGKVVEGIVSLSEIDEFAVLKDPEVVLSELKHKPNRSFIKDTLHAISWWSCFREKPDYGRKVGRNEPCPCGSGKKYKKCCGY